MSSCPYCRGVLAGLGERFCTNCGGDLEAVALPPPAPEAPASPFEPTRTTPGVPWERRSEVGFLTALVETTQRTLFSPVRFFSEMPTSGGLGSPLLYALLVGYASLVVASVYDFVLLTVTGPGRLPRLGPDFERVLAFSTGAGGIIIRLIIGPVMIVVQLFLLAGIYHLALLLLGGARGGFEATFRVLAYAGAAGLAALLPLCGAVLLQPVYYLVLAGIGFARAHQIGGGRAAVAVLLPLFLLCCCCLGLGLLFWGSLAALMQRGH